MVELDGARQRILTPPRDTTIRVRLSTEELKQGVKPSEKLKGPIMDTIAQQEAQGCRWQVEEANFMDDVVVLHPDPSYNENCTRSYPRIAVDQYAAAAIMRGADLMAVGVIGLDYGTELI